MRKTRWVLCALVSAAMVSSVSAVQLLEGTSEVRVNGNLQTDTPVGTDWNLGGGYGYFIRDQWEIGGVLELADNDAVSRYGFGLFTEYNFDTQSLWVPYIGIAGLWFGVDPERGSSEDSFVGRLQGGIKYFIADNVAIFGAGNFDWSPDDIFIDENLDANETQFSFELGIRFYIFP